MTFEQWYAQAETIQKAIEPDYNWPGYEPWWRRQHAKGVTPLAAVIDNYDGAIDADEIERGKAAAAGLAAPVS